MLTIEIKVNNKLIHKISAVNVSKQFGFVYGKGKQIYEILDPEMKRKNLVAHSFEDKALVLAIKLIKKIIKLQKNGNKNQI